MAGAVDDVARLADDVARLGDDAARAATAGADDVARATASATDDAARAGDDVAGVADDAARATDGGAASAADDVPRAGTDGLQVTGRSLLEQRASRYSDLVNSNEAWTWDDIAEGLSRSERREIRQAAIDDGLIPSVPVDPVTKFADFGDFVETEIPLPQELWSGSRNSHFSYLDRQYLQQTGRARPNTMTWHHHQDAGRMQLVPRGVHNAYNHNGGMSVWGGSNAPPSP